MLITGAFDQFVDHPNERGVVRLRDDITFDLHSRPVDQFTSSGDQPGRELGPADVDGEHDIR